MLGGTAWSRVIAKTWPTALALAENTVGDGISWPAGGPDGCSRRIRIEAPSGSMKVSSTGLTPAASGALGATVPEKPVTTTSPGNRKESCSALAGAEAAIQIAMQESASAATRVEV